jgi:hypothetical protein
VSANARRWLLACALAAAAACAGPAAADADRLYQWKAADGSLHITESPPPPDAALLRMYEAVATPAPPPGTPPAPPAAPLQEDDSDPCAAHPSLVQAWVDATEERSSAEREIARLDADPVYASDSECLLGSPSFGRCSFSTFSRDRALDRANERRELAEAKVERAEEAAARAGVPDRCLVEPGH